MVTEYEWSYPVCILSLVVLANGDKACIYRYLYVTFHKYFAMLYWTIKEDIPFFKPERALRMWNNINLMIVPTKKYNFDIFIYTDNFQQGNICIWIDPNFLIFDTERV